MTDETVNIRYMVGDVEQAVDFYTRLFDFELVFSAAPAFAAVRRGALRLLLSGPKSSAGRPMPDGRTPGPGGWNRMHFIVDDIHARGRAPAPSRRRVPKRRHHRPGRLPDRPGRPVREPRRTLPAGRVGASAPALR